ncbi:MAG TPA: TIR domain-containing protein, partial [Burkholderiaceae bacterium]|nr:TIR domain-containing protein [Burkholderiaceae bacterium]
MGDVTQLEKKVVSMSAAAATARSGAKTAPTRRDFASRLFGYDVFISFALGPAPRGSLSYASDLARRLRERDFAVFFSEDEAPPGEELDSTLRNALHRSRALVVISNRGTLLEPRWVRVEVESFRKLTPARPIIPISVGGALQDPQLAAATAPWLPFKDKIWLDEKQEAADSGVASADLVERLALVPKRVRSNVKWRWLVGAVAAALLLLAVGLAIAAKLARDAEQRARDELTRAVALRAAAEAPAMIAGVRAGGHERAVQQLLAAHALGAAPVEVGSAMLSVILAIPREIKVLDTGAVINAAAFRPKPDAAHFVSGGAGGRVQRWDAPTLRPLGAPLPGPSLEVFAVAYSPDGQRIAAGDLGGQVWLWDADSGEPVPGTTVADGGAIRSLAFTPDGKYIVSGGVGGELNFWDAQTAKPLGDPLQGFGEVIFALAISADGQRMVSGGDAHLQLWTSTRNGWTSVALEGDEPLTVLAVAFSRDGTRIASGSNAGTVHVWNAKTGTLIAGPLRARGAVNSVAFSADGTHLLSGAGGGALELWDTKSGARIAEWLEKQDGTVKAIAASADGRLVVTGGDDGLLRAWDASREPATGAPLAGKAMATSLPNCGPTSLPSMRVIGWSDDCAVGAVATKNALRLIDAKSGAPLGDSVPGHQTREVRDANAKEPRINLLSAAFSADGRYLVSGSQNGTLQRWERAPLRPLGALLLGHARDVSSVAFSPDGTTIASGDREGALRLWDAASGQPLGPPLSHRGGVKSVAFTVDGTQLVSWGEDGTLRAWPAPATWQAHLCAKLTRDMSFEQWQTWLS